MNSGIVSILKDHKEKINNILNKISYYLIVFSIIIIPICFLNRYHFLIKISLLNWIQVHHIYKFVLPIYIFVYFVKLILRKFKIDVFDVLLYIMIFCAIISTIFSVEQLVSLYGMYLRDDGLFVILYYYFLFLNAKDIINKKLIVKVINVVLIVGIIQFIYCILQLFVRKGSIIIFSLMNHMAAGFTGNPNFLGSFCVLALTLSIAMLFFYDKHKKLYFATSIIFYINLIFSQSTGPFLTYILVLIFLFIILIIKKKLKTKIFLILLAIQALIFVPLSNFIEDYSIKNYGSKIESYYTIKGDLTNMIFGGMHEGEQEKDPEIERTLTGSGRFTIWKNALAVAPKYLLTGSGIDTFAYVYPQENKFLLYDKAHNEYIQILVTEGIFSLLTYLTLLVLLFFKSLKSNNNLILILMISMCGYAWQAFLNIQTTRVAPFYFIVIGMLAGLINNEKTIKKV